jgi:hypothetical protein
MKALVTGASSGIGRDIALYLGKLGYDLILISNHKGNMEDIKNSLAVKVKTFEFDLSIKENVFRLYELVRKEDIDILVNNAGFGAFGEFNETDLDNELKMINLNINAVHILTKLFLRDFKEKNKGYIMNVSSSAAFQAGPLMATYYATKAYVLRITTAIYEELRRSNSNVVVCALCPGPVKTNFNNVANVKFDIKSVSSEFVARYAVNKMFKKKLIIIPAWYMKVLVFFNRLLPIKIMLKLTYNIQERKRTEK